MAAAAAGFTPLGLALLTVSDSRGPGEDRSGQVLAERAGAAGHHVVARDWVRDERGAIAARLADWLGQDAIEVVLTTGGTGVTGRDVTPEAVLDVCDKTVPGFGELFRWLSYDKIATSTIQSRALGAVAPGGFVFALPGSPGACRDAWDGILAQQLDSRTKPCNFAELLPRLAEE